MSCPSVIIIQLSLIILINPKQRSAVSVLFTSHLTVFIRLLEQSTKVLKELTQLLWYLKEFSQTLAVPWNTVKFIIKWRKWSTTVTYPGAGAKTGKKGQNQTTEAATRPPATLKELKKHNTFYIHKILPWSRNRCAVFIQMCRFFWLNPQLLCFFYLIKQMTTLLKDYYCFSEQVVTRLRFCRRLQ